jgi:hypothetical protein
MVKDVSHQLHLGGIVIGVPIRDEDAGDAVILEEATQKALKEAEFVYFIIVLTHTK